VDIRKGAHSLAGRKKCFIILQAKIKLGQLGFEARKVNHKERHFLQELWYT
jgi:hypothetical protein